MVISLADSVVGTFACYAMLMIIKDVFIEVVGLASPPKLTGRFLLVGLVFFIGTSPDAETTLMLCRMAAVISILHEIAQLINQPKIVDLVEKTGCVLVGYMAVMILLRVKHFCVELKAIEKMTGVKL